MPLAGDRLLLANWLRPKLGLFDAATGRTSRLTAGHQPVLAGADGEAHVLSAVEPAHWVLDLARRRLVPQPPPPVSVFEAVACDGLWAVAGGRLHVDRQGDRPTRMRRPSSRLQELTGARRTVELDGPVRLLFADAAAGELWAILDEDGDRLQRVHAGTAEVAGTYAAPDGGRFVHVAPQLGLALSVRGLARGSGAVRLAAHALPS